MVAASLPANESSRLDALRGLDVLDTVPEETFDRITRIASRIVNAPIVLVSLVDEKRQWFKSSVGLDARETPREYAFCAHAILGDEVLVVPDAREDPRFAENPLVTGNPNIRFYAGAPLKLEDNVRLGTLCAIDVKPRHMEHGDEKALSDLAQVVVDELRLRQHVRRVSDANTIISAQGAQLRRANAALEQFAYMASHDLRAPLKSIINLTDIVLLEAPEGEKKSLELIRSTAADLEDMVAGYRRLAKLECGAKKEMTLSELAMQAAKRSEAAIEVFVDEDAEFLCDPAMMMQAFVNLIDNAAKYGSGDTVTFKGGHDGSWVVVRTTNFVAQELTVDDSLLSPFRRLSDDENGTGLGLAIVDRIVQLHGGQVTASCEERQFIVEVRLPNAGLRA